MHASVRRQACTSSRPRRRAAAAILPCRRAAAAVLPRRRAAAAVLLLLAPARALAPPRIYFDVASAGGSLGRVEVSLESFDCLPRLSENLRLIASNERSPRCTFDGARLAHSPAGPNYKWAHSFEGSGNRPAIEASLLGADASSANRNDVVGGSYYGAPLGDVDVVLTTPLAGPGAKKARFSFVRIGASPSEWKQRLLINSAVLGVAISPDADDVLARLAALGPDDAPRIASTGVVDAADDDCLVPAPEDLDDVDDCLWDAAQEAAWREERFRKAEMEGNRDPARGNSGTVR